MEGGEVHQLLILQQLANVQAQQTEDDAVIACRHTGKEAEEENTKTEELPGQKLVRCRVTIAIWSLPPPYA